MSIEISRQILDMKEQIIADPAKGKRMIEGMATGSVVLNWNEYDLIQRWMSGQSGEGEKKQRQDSKVQ